MPSLTSTTVLSPSDLVDYMDTNRVCELLVDEGEDAIVVADLDTNDRAIKIAQRAWYYMTMATRRGDIYLGRELIDLANDSARGQPLVELVANIFWCSLQKRRRYTKDEPQAQDPACEEAEKMLEMLRNGERIFVLDGVTTTNSAGTATGTYENVKGPPTTLQVGALGSDGGNCASRLDRFFGRCTTDTCGSSDGTYRNYNRGGSGCC